MGAIVTALVLGLGTPTATELGGTALVVAGLLIGLTPSDRRGTRSAPAPTASVRRRDAWLHGQADDANGVDVGELGDDEGPGAHVQADQPQRP